MTLCLTFAKAIDCERGEAVHLQNQRETKRVTQRKRIENK